MNIIITILMALLMGITVAIVAIWKLLLSIAAVAIAIPMTIAFFIFKRK